MLCRHGGATLKQWHWRWRDLGQSSEAHGRHSHSRPQAMPVSARFKDDVARMSTFVSGKKALVVITGAGVSTESGIPDYRGPQGSYSKGHQPMTYQIFVSNEANQKRYWSRSMMAWPYMKQTTPSAPHLVLDQLRNFNVHHIITQVRSYCTSS